MQQTKYLPGITELIDERVGVFHKRNVVAPHDKIPENGEYPLADNQWLKIPDIVCLFVDIRNSTGLSATTHEGSTASIYELFTGTAIRIFHRFDASYIDIKGDGVFALFNANQTHRALVAAITFKSFVQEQFLTLTHQKLRGAVDIGFHMGIDQKTVLVKQLGIRDSSGHDRRKNEVWAGKPINMAAKLASCSEDGELLVSDRFYNNLSRDRYVQKTCGCVFGSTEPRIVDIWRQRDLSDMGHFDFSLGYSMNNWWCVSHGTEWAEQILSFDK